MIKHLTTLAVTISIATISIQISAEKTRKAQPAIIKTIRAVGQQWLLDLDFVEIRECHCDAGFEVVNKNTKIRSYHATNTTRILLLKNAGEHYAVQMDDLIAARKGKNFGWPFTPTTPFEFQFDATGKIIIEMRQTYEP